MSASLVGSEMCIRDSYFTSELKRGRGEVSERQLTASELAEFDEAKAKELAERLQEAALARVEQ
eukprot:1675581-Alexandrium_andersonii.AAC.1